MSWALSRFEYLALPKSNDMRGIHKYGRYTARAKRTATRGKGYIGLSFGRSDDSEVPVLKFPPDGF